MISTPPPGVPGNPDYQQGNAVPVQVPVPATVQEQPWQLPPGSAVPI